MSWKSREIAVIALSAALWSVLNATLSPIFFYATKLPFLCDFLGVLALMIVTWRVRRFGAATLTGLIATIITLSLNPGMVQFAGFAVSSVVFDLTCLGLGYSRALNRFGPHILAIPSLLMAFTSGVIIGLLFVSPGSLQFALWWGGIHALGGAIGASLGVVFLGAIQRRMGAGMVLSRQREGPHASAGMPSIPGLIREGRDGRMEMEGGD